MDPATVKLSRNAAMLDFEQGRLPEAEAALTGLILEIDIPQNAFLKNELCQCHIDRATVYRLSNRWQEALDNLARCEELAKTLAVFARVGILYNVHLTRARVLSTRASSVYDLAKAQASLAEARKLGVTYWGVDGLESDIAFRGGEWERAARLAGKTAEALAKEGWQRGAMSSRLRAGKAYLELGDRERASAEIEAAVQYFGQYGPPDLLASAWMARARLLAAGGEFDAAWELALRSLEEIEELIRHFRSLFDQQLFFLDKIEYYHQAFSVALAGQGRQGLLRAWTVAERAKSFYLCHLVANSDVGLFDGVDPEQTAQLGRLEQQLDDCEVALGRLEKNSEDRAGLERKQRELSDARRELMAAMMRANPRWAALRTPPAFDLESELKRLDPVWKPVSYFFQPRADGATLYIFHSGPDREPHCLQTTWLKEELEQLDQSRAQMRLPKEQRLFLPVFPENLVSRVFPPPLLDALRPGQFLLVSPHDRLRGMPLHALEIRPDEPLIGHYPVNYIPTLALLPLRTPERKAGEILLMACEQDGFKGRQLVEVRDEMDALHQVWSAARPGQAPPPCYIQPDGSPAQAGLPVEKWGKFEYIHIACHGVFPEGQPFDAALRLGSDALRASEFFNTRLNAALVSLSACEVGAQATHASGVELRGSEWVGLYLPLFYAGAQAMLVSLWAADSKKAAQYMRVLHTALSEGASPVEAYQRAALSQVRTNPVWWANWYLVGYPGTNPKTERSEQK